MLGVKKMPDKNLMHYIAVTGILINKEGKYLITKRAETEKSFPGKWTVPGGKLEALDYVFRKKDTSIHWYNIFEEVLIREVFEEVGLEIGNFGYITSMAYVRSDCIPCIIVSLYAYTKDENIKLSNELIEYAWVNLEEAKTYDLIEGIYEEIKILDNHLKSGGSINWKKE